MDTDEDVREQFRSVWPHLFHGQDKHWPLFECLTFSADAYNAAFLRELPGYDLREHIGRLDVPMLLIVGAEDAYFPHMAWLAATAVRSELRVFAKCGHFPFVEAPRLFAETVAAFLAR